MTDEERKLKQQEDDKLRCANYLLKIFEKYGAEVLAEHRAKVAAESTTTEESK